MANRKTLNEKIEAAKLEKEQAEARIKKLLQQQKAQARKDRNHRLCERGGKLEKLLPELARLTEEQFEIFVEKCLLTSFTRRVLSELAPPEPEQPDGENSATTAHTEPAPKTSPAANNFGVNSNTKPADAARVAS
jgi:hypothetical protein